MRMLRFALFAAVGAMLVPLVSTGVAHAQATRTWVSGVGDDANPCSRTAPCKTWAGAISKTADGGEISALDPGGFGAVTITKGITLNGDGTLASVLAGGTNGIIVSAPATRDVIIRNLSINGIGNTALPGLNGIRFLSGGSLTLQNVNIYGFNTSCVDVSFTAANGITHIMDSHLANCGTAINVSSSAAGQRASVNVTRSSISDSTTGINGVRQANIALTDVTISGSNTAVIISSAGVSPASEVNINRSLLTMSALGLQINAGASGRLSDNYFAANGKAMDNQGTCQSTANNRSGGNVNANTGAACAALPAF
jgi:hypothetical protein